MDDKPYNTHKAGRIRKLRKHVNDAVESNRRSDFVYVKRGSTGVNRCLLNESELIGILLKRGFDIIEPESMDVMDIAGRMSGAKLILGVEGSHMSLANYFLHENGCFMNIQQPDRFNPEEKIYADWIGQRYAYIVGDYVSTNTFTIDICRLEKVLDKVGSLI